MLYGAFDSFACLGNRRMGIPACGVNFATQELHIQKLVDKIRWERIV